MTKRKTIPAIIGTPGPEFAAARAAVQKQMEEMRGAREAKLTKALDAIKHELLRLGQQGQAAYMMISAADLENILEELLKTRMRNFSNKKEKKFASKLFKQHGAPFNGFSNKIDAAYALGIIGSELHEDLHAFRDIRNAFAHTREKLHYDKEAVGDLFGKLKGYEDGMKREQFMSETIERLRAALHKAFEDAPGVAAFSAKGNANAEFVGDAVIAKEK